MSTYIIAADLGTTSTKTLVIDREGRVQASHSIEYGLYTPKPNYAEQDPDEIFTALLDAIAAVIAKAGISAEQVLCVTFSSAMHSLIAVDEQVRPLTASITFADNRSSDYIRIVKDQHDGHQIYRRTGTPIHPMSPLLKLMWLRDHEPEIFAQTHRFIGIKEYAFAKLFDKFVIDYSLASATGLFNLEQLNWDEGALKAAGITGERLSEPVDTTYRISGMNPVYAQKMGLAVDTPFVIGASDGVLANLGIGATEPGVYAVTIGTSGAVRGVVRQPVTDDQERSFCYALHKDLWVIGGAINNGGIMFRWVRDQLATLEAEEAVAAGIDPYERLTAIAGEVEAGAEGLIFMPFLAGERAPHWNTDARGVFFGLGLHHQKKHMIRAVLEGVMYRIHSVVAALEDVAQPATEIRASGGFARSELWCQMLADVLGIEVTIPDSIESSGIGAAKLAMLAMGEVQDWSELDHWVSPPKQRLQPDKANHDVYQELTDIYMNTYHALKDSFTQISAYQKRAQQ